MPESVEADAPRRRGRLWVLMVMGLLLLAGGVHWATKVDRDPRLLGDWYSPDGRLFRFQADGTVETYLQTTDLTHWSTRNWYTEGNIIRMARQSSGWSGAWNRLVETFRPSGVQVVLLQPSDYRITEWGSSTVMLQRLSRNSARVLPVEKFTRTPPPVMPAAHPRPPILAPEFGR